MKQLSPRQSQLVTALAQQLGAIPGMQAVVLGGSHARGRALPESDIDLGLLYSDTAPFSIRRIRELAESLNDTAAPVVTDFYQWGPWVNGGAWLTIGGQRVDLLYRSREHLERVITEAQGGRYEVHYLQQPPFGFFSGTYLGELAICIPLLDPEGRVADLKRKVSVYPEALRRTLLQDYLFMAEFTLTAFAPKMAARADAYGAASCLTRGVNELVMALFALNRQYPINDKTVLAEVAEFEHAPQSFGPRVQEALVQLRDLNAAVGAITQLLRETIELTDGLYHPRFVVPR